MLSGRIVKGIAAGFIISGMMFSTGICEAQMVKAKSSNNASPAENAKRQQMLKDRQAKRELAKAFKISNLKNIATESMPADVYEGSDKAKLKELVLNAWKNEYPKDDIMGVRFIAKDWKSNENVHYSAAEKNFYVNDKAALVVSVIIKTSPEVATIFPAYINKDNKTGAMNAGVQTKTNEYVVKQMMVVNYKE